MNDIDWLKYYLLSCTLETIDKEMCLPWNFKLCTKGRPIFSGGSARNQVFRAFHEPYFVKGDFLTEVTCGNEICLNPHHIKQTLTRNDWLKYFVLIPPDQLPAECIIWEHRTCSKGRPLIAGHSLLIKIWSHFNPDSPATNKTHTIDPHCGVSRCIHPLHMTANKLPEKKDPMEIKSFLTPPTTGFLYAPPPNMSQFK